MLHHSKPSMQHNQSFLQAIRQFPAAAIPSLFFMKWTPQSSYWFQWNWCQYSELGTKLDSRSVFIPTAHNVKVWDRCQNFHELLVLFLFLLSCLYWCRKLLCANAWGIFSRLPNGKLVQSLVLCSFPSLFEENVMFFHVLLFLLDLYDVIVLRNWDALLFHMDEMSQWGRSLIRWLCKLIYKQKPTRHAYLAFIRFTCAMALTCGIAPFVFGTLAGRHWTSKSGPSQLQFASQMRLWSRHAPDIVDILDIQSFLQLIYNYLPWNMILESAPYSFLYQASEQYHSWLWRNRCGAIYLDLPRSLRSLSGNGWTVGDSLIWPIRFTGNGLDDPRRREELQGQIKLGFLTAYAGNYFSEFISNFRVTNILNGTYCFWLFAVETLALLLREDCGILCKSLHSP